MQFGGLTPVGPRNHVLDGVGVEIPFTPRGKRQCCGLSSSWQTNGSLGCSVCSRRVNNGMTA